MTPEPFAYTTPAGRVLHGFVDAPGGAARPCPTVVVCHGFKGFMEWGFFPHLAELLRQRGHTVVRFNFSGAGMRPGDERVTDLDAFRDNTLRRERDDLLALLAALGDEIAPGRADTARLGLFGHSRGGAAALGAAASDDWSERVRALVTWAAIGRIDRVPADQMGIWRRQGTLPVVNARTGQELALGPGLREEVETLPADLDPTASAGRRRAPWLIVHGSDDESVPLAEGHQLAAAAADPFELLEIPGGSHTFGAVHPFAAPTPELIAALNATQTWFRRYL